MFTNHSPLYNDLFARNYGVFNQQEQTTIHKSKVVVVGAGGVGGITLISLARMGFMHLRIVDSDSFEKSNLNRQMLATCNDLDQEKANVAAQVLTAINPEIQVDYSVTQFTEDNAAELLTGYDIVVDATDNLVSRVIIHRAAAQVGIPSVWIAVTPPFRGGVMSFVPEGVPFEVALRHPSHQQDLSETVCQQINALKDGRAQHAVTQGALADWADGYLKGKAPWAVICPVANMIGLLASVEVLKFVLQRPHFEPSYAPQLIQLNLQHNPMIWAETPESGSWDNTKL